MVVGHSAAASLAWIAADRRALAGVALIGGFPVADGEAYADFLPIVDGAMPFPGWAAFEGPDAADLDPAARDRLAASMTPVPEAVAKGIVRLRDDARYDVGVTLICPEFGLEDARAWLAAGELPELAKARRLELVDLDSGHWPMVTQPARLAALLAGVQRLLVVEQSHSRQFYRYLRAHYALPGAVRVLSQPGPLPIRPAAVLTQLLQWS